MPLGRKILKLPAGSLKLQESQAAAASGQIVLAHTWQHVLSKQNLTTGQVLLTLTDTEQRRRYLNARATLFTLMDKGAIPLINENDTVATSEIRYGDNDRLAARVTSMISADCLVLLSDVDGLYTRPPGEDGASFVPFIERITPAVEAMAGQAKTDVGSGGMITKIDAAKIAVHAGANMVIAAGQHMHPLQRIADGEKCTWFKAASTPLQARKRWISGTLEPLGVITIDNGAEAALAGGKSLLPAGVVKVSGRFERGDAVTVINDSGREIARGLIAYDSREAERIAGRQSGEIPDIIGYEGRNELIHRDDMVLLEN